MRLKFALVGAVGGALVLLPLGEVLRRQGAELALLVDERTLLDPLARAVAVQRGLLGHHDVADRVLRGRHALEAERRLRHAEVDRELAALQGTLVAGAWLPALRENNALKHDWQTLVQRVAQRQITAADSATSHQLLVQQAVQVMDLVSAAAPAPDLADNPPALAALQDRITAQQARLHTREAAVRSQRSLVHTALAGLALLAGLGAAAAGRARRTPTAPPADGTLHDGIRRGPGRRSTDTAGQRTEPDLPWQHRRAQAPLDTASEPPPSAPGPAAR